MGREAVGMRYSATVSRHNSERDAEDDALWADFRGRVRAIADEPKYEPIFLMGGYGDDD
jgi:hypothetical protein